jgi:membrane protein
MGKFLLGWYLGRSSMVSAYGAAGSVVLVLLWVYYSAQILFFGAEITKAYANHFGRHIQPAEYARWALEAQPKPAPEYRDLRVELRGPRLRRQEELVSELKREVETLREVVER